MINIEVDPTAVKVVTLFFNLKGLVGEDQVIAKVKELTEEVVVGIRIDHVAIVTTICSHFSYSDSVWYLNKSSDKVDLRHLYFKKMFLLKKDSFI